MSFYDDDACLVCPFCFDCHEFLSPHCTGEAEETVGMPNLAYFHDHTHACACGGWRHEAVDCDLPSESPCPICDIEAGLVPMATGTKLVQDAAGYSRLAYEGE